MLKALRILTIAVDILLILDVASDLVRKCKERKAKKDNEPISTEKGPEPAPVA